MIIHDITGTEDHHLYQELQVENLQRQLDFIRSMVKASIVMQRSFLSQRIIRALNFHAITCLHHSAGEYRPCPVTVGKYDPPPHFQVPSLMDDFTNTVNSYWNNKDSIFISSYVLWRLNFIHPFINGNGRTARAASYFVLCVKSGGLLPGSPILPELLQRDRNKYVAALQEADAGQRKGKLDLVALIRLLSELMKEQLDSADS